MARPPSRGRVPPSTFRPVRTPRTVQDTVSQLVEAIRSGAIQEGDLLPSERDLADRLQVSRPTVRSALGAMADAGLVTVASGRGGGARIVSIWIPRGLAAAAGEALPADELVRLLEARRVIEPSVALMAAERADDADFERLARTIELQRTHLDDRPKAVEAEERFHRVLWRAAASPPLEEALAGVFSRLEVARDMVMRDDDHMEAALAMHETTLEALRHGSAEDIRREMDGHLGYLEGLVEEVVGRRIDRGRTAFVQPRRG